MDCGKFRLLYFSPTGTTRKILEAIAHGTGRVALDPIDLTLPGDREGRAGDLDEALVVIGAPVYAGRLPTEAVERLRRFRGNGAPAVIVVVYGNRAYDDALLELRDLALEMGFLPIAAGAFVGEHSFSNQNTPIAVGRPDAADLQRAAAFGGAIAVRLGDLSGFDAMSPLRVPGNAPYRDGASRGGVAPVSREDFCIQCGLCAGVCPMAAIRLDLSPATDTSRCIRCHACVKACPTGARVMDDPGILEIAKRLCTNCGERKEPETFL
jgi:ferredoxin